MKQAEEALDGANELGLNNDQPTLYQQLQMKLPRQRAVAVSNKLSPSGLSVGGASAETQDMPMVMVLVSAGEFTMEAISEMTKSLCDASTSMHSIWTSLR